MFSADALAFARSRRQRSLAELKDFIRFPTVSAQPRHEGDMRRCASWLARHLLHVGLEGVRVVATARHPLVYGEWLGAAHRPTLLIYGHYDVQPVDPVKEWRTPPLWGIGLTQTITPGTSFLHDGRARSFEEAIMWHGGEAQAAHDAFQNASQSDREALTAFLSTL